VVKLAFFQPLSIEWIKENIKEPVPMNDKSRVHELLDVLSHEDHTVPEIDGALNALGMMSVRYGAFFIIMCGAIPLIKKYLLSDIKPLSFQAARTLKYIAKTGGCEELIQENIHEDLRSIIIDINKDFDIRDMCANAYGWILANPPAEINSEIVM